MNKGIAINRGRIGIRWDIFNCKSLGKGILADFDDPLYDGLPKKEGTHENGRRCAQGIPEGLEPEGSGADDAEYTDDVGGRTENAVTGNDIFTACAEKMAVSKNS